jgi:hypothetical protein
VFSKYLDAEHLYHDLNPEVLQTIYDKITDNANEGIYSMLIIDDFGPQLKQKSTDILMQRFVAKMRHMKIGQIWILCQNYYQMPRKLRELATNVLLWNTNKSQNKKMYQEQFQMNEDRFEQLMRHCPTTHDWLLLNLKYKRIFNKDWDEIVFKED